jgi:transcriptional repressor NrdR
MRCPLCSNLENRVLESRAAEGGHSVRRRRECLGCGYRFTTYERVEMVPLMVLKRDGRREPFDRHKILEGLQRATGKTGITGDRLEALTAQVEATFQTMTAREIPTVEIGAVVLQHLRPVSEVAYIRFASVYSQFQTVQDFMAVVKEVEQTVLPGGRILQSDNEIGDETGGMG